LSAACAASSSRRAATICGFLEIRDSRHPAALGDKPAGNGDSLDGEVLLLGIRYLSGRTPASGDFLEAGAAADVDSLPHPASNNKNPNNAMKKSARFISKRSRFFARSERKDPYSCKYIAERDFRGTC
jgi:hypothetical protein